MTTVGTVAYFSTEDTAKNVITTGDLQIEILEKMVLDDKTTLVPYEDKLDVMPGCVESKIVCVKNIGGQEAYIRVSVEKAITLASNERAKADASLVTYDLNEEYWVEKDGFYYYNRPLAKGEVSEPLLTGVAFSGSMGNMYQGSEVTIKINAYAVQTANNGATTLEAAGWPEQG